MPSNPRVEELEKLLKVYGHALRTFEDGLRLLENAESHVLGEDPRLIAGRAHATHAAMNEELNAIRSGCEHDFQYDGMFHDSKVYTCSKCGQERWD